MAGEDYVSSTGELVFAPGDSEQCHQVLILEDSTCEEEEHLFSNLTAISENIEVDPDIARVEIDDSLDCREFLWELLRDLFVSKFLIRWGVCQ